MSERDNQPGEPLVEPLTRREREILTLLAQGFSAPEIAEQLTLATSSVKFHIQNIYGKLGVKSKRQALTRAAQLGLLSDLPATALPGPLAGSPAPPLPAPPHNLPVQLTHFIGRTQQMAEARQLLRTARLVTLTGPGGTGKTRLALQIAAESLADFPHGAWLVELAPIADGAQAPQAVAQALAVRVERSVDPEAAGRAGDDPLTLLVEHLRDKRLLLVLDNCEHIVAACAVLAEHLLRAAPGLRILATSREALGVIGENSLPVPALAVPAPGQLPALEALGQSEAVQLFVERARAVRPDFALTAETAPAVVQVCRQLDGIPLAIELAAARTRALTVEQIAAHLAERDRFGLLTGGSRTAPPRQQTLRATIDWSYELLTEAEQALLQRLSVFAGGATVEAAEQMLGTPDALDLLTQSVAKSLVRAIHPPGQEARFTLLEMIREYAHSRLGEAGEADLAHGRHLAYYLALAEAAEPELKGPAQITWLKRLDREHDNLRAALAWAVKSEDAEPALRLAGALFYFWHIRHNETEGRRWLEAALDVDARQGTPGPSARRAKALLGAGWLNAYKDRSPSLSRLEKAVDIYVTLGDRAGIAFGQYLFGQHYNSLHDFPRAHSHYQTALGLWTAAEDGWGIGICLYDMANNAWAMGERPRALELYQRSLDVLREVGDRWQLIMPLSILGERAFTAGDIARSQSLLAESRAIGQELGDKTPDYYIFERMAPWLTEHGRYAEAIEVIHHFPQDSERAYPTAGARLGEVAYRQGRLEEATRLYESAYAGFGAENDLHGQAWPLARLGCIAYRLGDLGRAARLLEESLDHLGPAGWYWNQALALLVQGDLARARGQYAAAGERYTRSLKVVGLEPSDLPDRLEAFAKLAGATRQPQRAARLFGAASALRERLRVPLPPVERADHEAALAQAREQVDAPAFSAAWAEGAAMNEAQATALALEENAEP